VSPLVHSRATATDSNDRAKYPLALIHHILEGLGTESALATPPTEPETNPSHEGETGLNHGLQQAAPPLTAGNSALPSRNPAANIGLASDIGCSLSKTVEHSPLVGPIASRLGLQLYVNAFHGWAHNRLCQLGFHPLYCRGLGLEDLEGMERLFSQLNGVARGVRGATPYHWMQAYDLYLRQWDEDKYANLSM
jgi:hypothetical protein